MNEPLLHSKENSSDTESFLKENGERFSQDCITAMKLMYQGVRLNGETCKQLYGIHDRRLRDCRQGRPDIVRSEWKRDSSGKRLYVEFWIDPIKVYPTKQELQEWFSDYQNETPIRYMKGKPNASDFAKNIITIGKQINLF